MTTDKNHHSNPTNTKNEPFARSVESLKKEPNNGISLGVLITIRTADSAFIYNILEAQEGLCAYSTVKSFEDTENNLRCCQLSLVCPLGLLSDFDLLLQNLLENNFLLPNPILPQQSLPNPSLSQNK